MTDEKTDDFPWGDLGEQWWRTTGAECRASEQQIRFACSRHQGATATGAARLAGYEAAGDGIRQAGHRASRSTAVLSMLALAEVEDKPAAPKTLDKAARVAHLSDIANKSPDPTLKIRAIEALNKMDDRDTELGKASDQDGFSEARYVREMLQAPGGAVAIVSIWVADGRSLANLPLLHDVHKTIMRDDPVFWGRAVSRTDTPGRIHLKNVLAKPDWQIETRVKLWREVGIEVDSTKSVDLTFLDRPAGGNEISPLNGHSKPQGATQ